MTHRQENQSFAIRNIIIGHCGETLTPNNVDKIVTEIETEMFTGSMSWAFKPEPES